MINTQAIGSYLQVNTADIVSVAETTLKALGLDYYRHTSNNGKITQFKLPDVRIDDGDSGMTGQIYIRNSMVPGTALTVLVGAYRLICQNGLVIGVGEGGRVIHRVGQKAEDFVSQLPEMINRSVINLERTLQDTIDEHQAITVADPLDVVLSLPIQNSVKESVILDVTTGRVTEDIGNVWGLYNYVNEATRKKSRSWSSALTKDIGLIDHIKLLAENQVAA